MLFLLLSLKLFLLLELNQLLIKKKLLRLLKILKNLVNLERDLKYNQKQYHQNY